MKLSKTEARILSTLEQANGEVVSRQSFGIESESNTLEVLICRLRKKLNDHGTKREIQTVRGRGYRVISTAKMEIMDIPTIPDPDAVVTL